MSKKKRGRRGPTRQEWLLFVDTNILLDFYRVRNEQHLGLLDRLETVHDRIITTQQVQMEFMRNRQGAIIETLQQLKNVKLKVPSPALVKDLRSFEAANKRLGQAEKSLRIVRDQLQRAMEKPAVHDLVYIAAQKLFGSDTDLNLNRNKDDRYRIRKLAIKRFVLGYPPRKKNDTSIGDAINWEWIVHCASHGQNRNVVIVSRDSDFGRAYGSDYFVNDWLSQEFRHRVSKQKSVVLTGSLVDGLKKLDQDITPQEEEEEKKLIRQMKRRTPLEEYGTLLRILLQERFGTVEQTQIVEPILPPDPDDGDGEESSSSSGSP